ncbi:MAG: CbiX/SirB N-terminal domain-containing protein [Hyphomicrobiales bacterium]
MLIAAHGERGGALDNTALDRLAASVAAALPGQAVSAGVLYGEPSIERAVDRLGACPMLVYPLFFSDGRFVSEVLPQRLDSVAGQRAFSILTPLGLDPRLPLWLADRIEVTARARRFDLSETFVLIAAHGSTQSNQPRNAVMLLAERLARQRRGAPVGFGFLDEPPYLVDVISQLPDQAIIIALFTGRGLHSAEDLPLIAAASGRSDVPVIGPIGTDFSIAPLIADAVSKHVVVGF